MTAILLSMTIIYGVVFFTEAEVKSQVADFAYFMIYTVATMFGCISLLILYIYMMILSNRRKIAALVVRKPTVFTIG